MRASLLTCAACLLCACTMIPRTTPPTQAVPQAWHDSAGSRATAAAPETPWWTAFPDTTLRGLIRAALARNTEVRGAAENVTGAEAYLRAARGALLPSLYLYASAATGGSRTESRTTPSYPYLSSSSVSRSTSDRYGAGLDAVWDPDLFGARRSAIAGAEADLRGAEERRRALSLAITTTVATAYAGLRQIDRLKIVFERTLADRSRILEVAQRRAGSGPQGDLDVLRAGTEAESARRALVDVAEAAAHSENALSLLVGRTPGTVPRSPSEDAKPLAATVPLSLPAVLLQRRPDVRIAEQDLAASAAYVGTVRADLLPHLTLSASGDLGHSVSRYPTMIADSMGMETVEVTRRYTGDSRSWNLSASLSHTLFAGGRNVAYLRAAESRARGAAIAYEATVLRALTDAEDALASVRFAAQRRVSLDSQVVQTRAALALAEGRYERGEGPFLDVLYAQGANLSAETGAVYAWLTELVAFIDLYRALGGGWESAEGAGATAPAR